MIYFMQSVDGGPIKIGHTVNLKSRHRQLEKHYGVQLAILGTLDGDLDTEAEIHHRFAHLRFSNKRRSGHKPEQFRPAPDLMEFIGCPLLVGANVDATEVMRPTDKGTKPLRLDLPPKLHRLLRLVAAHNDMSMSAYVRDQITRIVVDMAKQKGIKGDLK